jgi:hypothetical protein
MSAEALLAAGYCTFLVLVAVGLDALARHSQHRSGRYRTAGFSFLSEHDAWRCPEGEFLRRIEVDSQRRIVRYRARAAVCNACPAKAECTDSDLGREIAAPIDPWPHSEAGRFHRGISVALVAIGVLVAAAAMARNPGLPDLAVLGSALALAAITGARLALAFSSTPSGFPDGGGQPEHEHSLTIR